MTIASVSADRTPVADDDVVSPADGKVMYAGPGQDGVAPEGEWQQVSIFLSAFDVHINRAPYGGRLRAGPRTGGGFAVSATLPTVRTPA